jgi:hypothetical protein
MLAWGEKSYICVVGRDHRMAGENNVRGFQARAARVVAVTCGLESEQEQTR